MGRTLASYRQMLEKERALWQAHYANRLRGSDQSSFARLWEKAFQLADAASCNIRPIVFDNIIMSMLVAQQSEIQRLRERINQLEMELSKARPSKLS